MYKKQPNEFICLLQLDSRKFFRIEALLVSASLTYNHAPDACTVGIFFCQLNDFLWAGLITIHDRPHAKTRSIVFLLLITSPETPETMYILGEDWKLCLGVGGRFWKACSSRQTATHHLCVVKHFVHTRTSVNHSCKTILPLTRVQ